MSIRLKDEAALKAASSTKLATARTINGTSFDGSANITTSNWGTARNITIGNTAKSVNGSGNVSWSLSEIGAVGLASPAFTGTPTAPTAAAGTSSTQLATTAFVTTAVNNKTSVSGNAGTATKLQTARTINGTSFDGTANITTANWGTARNLTIGNKAKSVNGSANVSWTLDEIGASDKSLHKNNYVRVTVGGDAATYYPVVINFSKTAFPFARLNISRIYSWTAPDTWNTNTHKGGLTLAIRWNGDNYWGGNAGSTYYVESFSETYTTMVAGLDYCTAGLVVWLRGGTALYQIDSDYGTGVTATVYTTTYTDGASRTYAPRTDTSKVNSEIKARWSTRGNSGVYDNNNRVYSPSNPQTTITGNAGTATTLQTARTINGTSFNGSANITTANWGTARTLTIGKTGKSVNGSGNVSWSLSEIGALPLTGGTLTGALTANAVVNLECGAVTAVDAQISFGGNSRIHENVFALNDGDHNLNNIYLGPRDTGEVRVVSFGDADTLDYRPVRAQSFVSSTGSILHDGLSITGNTISVKGTNSCFSGESGYVVIRTNDQASNIFLQAGKEVLVVEPYSTNVYKPLKAGNTFTYGSHTVTNQSSGVAGQLYAGTGGFVVQAEAGHNLHLGANNRATDINIYGDSSGNRIEIALETTIKSYTNSNGIRVKNNYIELYPFSSSYGSGSRAQIYYNANDKRINIHARSDSDNSTNPIAINIGGAINCGSLSTSGEVKSGNIRLNGANTIHNTANGIWINGTHPDYPSYLGTLVVSADSAGGRVYSQAVYNRKFTAGANMHINTGFTIGYTSSARKYKLDIMDIEKDQHEKILDLVPKSWFDRTTTEQYAHYLTRRARGENVSLEDEGIGYLDRVNGLVAEDVEDVGLGNFVNYGDLDEDGNREVLGIQYDRLWTLLIPVVRKQRDAIKELKEVVQEQQNQINELKDLLQKTA